MPYRHGKILYAWTKQNIHMRWQRYYDPAHWIQPVKYIGRLFCTKRFPIAHDTALFGLSKIQNRLVICQIIIFYVVCLLQKIDSRTEYKLVKIIFIQSQTKPSAYFYLRIDSKRSRCLNDRHIAEFVQNSMDLFIVAEITMWFDQSLPCYEHQELFFFRFVFLDHTWLFSSIQLITIIMGIVTY